MKIYLFLGLSKLERYSEMIHNQDYSDLKSITQLTHLKVTELLPLRQVFFGFFRVGVAHVQIGSCSGHNKQKKQPMKTEDARGHISLLNVQNKPRTHQTSDIKC